MDVIYLDHDSYPELTNATNTAYSFTANFEKYLNKTQYAFDDVALFVPTIQIDIITHIQSCVINTTNTNRIENLMDKKTNLMVETAKNKCA
ncbi:unnamed protein product [Pseudo-nitzschia multistriata]|uniref:Uncharacterized protein n=1 Tax=Pseudo-nitzschia multistriata TaxID=183589 RepID=A0A448ZDP7_9STRA|nr:unnamed protein product [Pseudo-nitzschia multistriata]